MNSELLKRRVDPSRMRRIVRTSLILVAVFAMTSGAAHASLVYGYKAVTGTLAPGGTITYTVTLFNGGTLQLDNPGDEFTDVLPPELTLVSATATAGTAVATVPTRTVTWNGSIAGSDSVTITITATISPATPLGTLVSNQGSISYDSDGNGTNDVSTLTDDPGSDADPTIFTVQSPSNVTGTKTVTGTPQPGNTMTYTVTLGNSLVTPQIDNAGDEFVDVLPAQLALVSASASSGTAVATIGTNTVAWNGSIPGSGSVTVTITATITAATPGGTVVSNQGTISYDSDGDGINDAARTTDDPGVAGSNNPTLFTVLAPATIVATKTKSGPVAPGGAIAYTIVLSNSSAFTQLDNPGNEFTDVLPSQLILVSALATSGTAVATIGTNTVTWNGSIPGGGSVTLTINATIAANVPGGTIVSNQGTVSFDADGNATNETTAATDDPGVAGASNPTVFTVLAPTSIAASKIKSGPAAPGSAITYTVVLSNGTAFTQPDNPGNEFADVLPSQLTLVSASATSGTAVATIGTNTVTWNGSIPGTGSVTVTINATIKLTNLGGTIVSNQGTVNFDGDGNGTNEASGLTDDPGAAGAADPTVFTFLSPATVVATKSVVGPFTPGATVTYTIVLTNNSALPQSDNPGSEFTDVLPAQLTLVSASATSGAAVATPGTNTVTWDGSIAGGGTVTISITATIKSSVPISTVVSNQGSASYDADGNGTNDATVLTVSPAGGGTTTFSVSIPVPILDEAGLALLAVLLAAAGIFLMRTRKPA